ncbi:MULTISPECIES: TonB-dependent receptor [Sphingomonas]|uniref:TonB-dependent receptor n=1 Tax=Sphingomonas molluscorum TaxID=418184 RepID=A0ABU8Q1P4_9SPHN|nr:TonB-dependent receptor [Sphingomonas sp. JUb134]MBM7404459.1 outer membrane receptor protein involved in Fe transport [Sphingomonas sp. JUb134]MBM7407639.1 outer membrane receptor protein involved in Fe transport [Sphingomonas sp. JUb134]
MPNIKQLAYAALPALCFVAAPSWAQETTSAAASAEASDPQAAVGDVPPEEIIVTGSTRAQRRFDVSYAINTISQADVEKIAPVNFADLIGQLPGFQTEITGGEVQNIYRIRGLPNDGGFVSFQQDGLPLFHENDGVFFRGDAILKQDLMTDHAEVVRGGPAPVYASYSGAIINAITVTGEETPRGKAQLTLGDTGLYRLDAYQSGPIAKDTYYAVGGFLRYHDGYRDNGFPNDKGGQIRANLKHDLDNGSIKLNLNYVNDHNVFYLPIPIADPRDPSVSLDPYIDYFTGTMNSPALRNVNLKYRDGAGVIQSRTSDLSDGRHMQMVNFGAQYDADFDGWLVSAKVGYTQGKLDFTAFYSTTNPADADSFANGYLARATAAFGAVNRFGYVLAGTNTVYDPDAASGLVMQGQYRDIHSKFYSGQGNFTVAKKFETGIGSHDIKLGLYASLYGEDSRTLYQNYLIEVAGKPRTLDLVAYSASGAELGRVTDNGVLNYAATLNQGDSDAKMFAIYANDTWEIVPGLRIDAGIRHERYSYEGWAALTEQADLGDRTTLADDATRAFTGAIINQKGKPNVTNWTVGANYDFSDHVGVYGRASHLETPPSVQTVMSINPTIITTVADQFEAGLKLAAGRSYLYVTGFYTNFDPLNASFLAYDPTTGRNDVNVPFIGEAQVKGVEFDGAWSVTPWFTLNGALTVSDPKYKNFESATGADPEQAEGNQIVRQPKIYGNIRPSFDFTSGETDISVYGRYTYMGKRYVDLYNNTALPSYGTIGAGVTLRRASWQVQVVGDNLFNAHGLTEGNTRTDSLSGQGSSEAIYGRPIFGRNFRLVVSKSW